MIASRREMLRLAGRASLLLAALGIGGCATPRAAAPPRHLTVLVSGAFEPALHKLAPLYEERSGVRIVIVPGPSMGQTAGAIPMRLARGEEADVVILAREALDRLSAAGKILPASETDLVLSKIAVAVKAGAPAPNIATAAALRETLLTARSVAYSDSASGVYISGQLFTRLGIAEAMRAKSRMIPATPVGLIIARGDAEIGFQQLSELKPIDGIHIVGLLPDDVQKTTTFSAGTVRSSTKHEESKRFVKFLLSKSATAKIRSAGLLPASHQKQ